MKSGKSWQRTWRQPTGFALGSAGQAHSGSAIGDAGTATNHRWHPLTAAIQARWSLFGDDDLQNVATREDLIAALQSKYRITEEQATAQVTDWLAGNS